MIVAATFLFLREPELGKKRAASAASPGSGDEIPAIPRSETGEHRLSHSAAAFSTKPKLVHSRPEQVLDGNYAELLPGLKQKASAGDAVAAYQVATMLEDCKRMFRGYDDDATNRERLDKCSGVTQQDLDDAVRWLQKAADAGSAEAMGAYPLYGSLDLTMTDAIRDPQAIQDYKDRSKRYLETLATAGSPAAMYHLARDYSNGTVGPPNFELAYAYDFAAMLLMGHGTNDGMLPTYSSRLNEGQIEAAQALGRRMVAACCPNGPPPEFWHPGDDSE